MDIEKYLISLGIEQEGIYDEEGAYIINILSSKEYGEIFTKLEGNEDVEPIQSNQLVTEQGSSLMYESSDESLLLNLIADFENGVYQLIITEI